MDDIILPATDGGVAAQAVVLVVATSVSAWLARANRELLIFVLGLAVFVAGLMALRAVH